ncbi:MAG: DUF308 domain-containing protein [Betaproteobacteria bacterium]|nr:DUF308 domain-containing protein [Betaproteobacteria bacterium]
MGSPVWLGILLIVLGVLAVLSPAIAGGAVVSVVGVILIVAGLVQVWRALQAAGSEKVLTLILGAIAVIAGIAVVLHPLLGLAFLTLLLAVYFAAEGVWKLFAAFRYRPLAGWLLASGVLSLVLAWLIWSQWPISGLWAVGVLVGVNLLATGAALVTLAGLSAKAPRAP